MTATKETAAPTCDIVDDPAVSCIAALAKTAVPSREDLQVILAHQRQAPACKGQSTDKPHSCTVHRHPGVPKLTATLPRCREADGESDNELQLAPRQTGASEAESEWARAQHASLPSTAQAEQ